MNNAPEFKPFFESMLLECFNEADAKRVVDGSSFQRPVSFRANTLLSSAREVSQALDAAGIEWSPVAWYPDAFVAYGVRERDFWELPIYREGKIYLQSLSAMIPALILGAQSGDDVCDMCAAPGGKTSQIAALADGKALITACELHMPRAEKLEYNLKKLGVRGTTIMRTDARQLDEFFSFDRILLDAPCSGSGTLRIGDPKAAKRFTKKLVDKSVKAQRALITTALALMKPGGTLVYATCSVLTRENEEVVEWGLERMRKRGSFELAPIEFDGLDELPLLPSRLDGAICVCPSDLYEGFFIAKVVRTA